MLLSYAEFAAESRLWSAWRKSGTLPNVARMLYAHDRLLKEQFVLGCIQYSTEVLHRHAAYDNLWRLIQVAKNDRSKTEQAFFGFVNVSLTQADKKRITENVLTDVEIVAWQAEMILTGYTVSVKTDTYANVPIVIVKCVDPDHADYGWCMSSRHRDLRTAFTSAQFKHETKTEGDWSKHRGPAAREEVFD